MKQQDHEPGPGQRAAHSETSRPHAVTSGSCPPARCAPRRARAEILPTALAQNHRATTSQQPAWNRGSTRETSSRGFLLQLCARFGEANAFLRAGSGRVWAREVCWGRAISWWPVWNHTLLLQADNLLSGETWSRWNRYPEERRNN